MGRFPRPPQLITTRGAAPKVWLSEWVARTPAAARGRRSVQAAAQLGLARAVKHRCTSHGARRTHHAGRSIASRTCCARRASTRQRTWSVAWSSGRRREKLRIELLVATAAGSPTRSADRSRGLKRDEPRAPNGSPCTATRTPCMTQPTAGQKQLSHAAAASALERGPDRRARRSTASAKSSRPSVAASGAPAREEPVQKEIDRASSEARREAS